MRAIGMRPCINQSCFPVMGTREFAACVSAAGFHSVELRTLGRTEPPSVIRGAVEENTLRVEAINGLMDWALPDDPDPRPDLERVLEVAVAVDAPLIVCAAPIRQGEMPGREVVLVSAAERLFMMAEVSRAAGVGLALEQVGRSSTRPGAVSGIRLLDDALAIAGRAGDDVLLTLDSYNLATADERFDMLGRVPAAKVGIAQIAGSSPGSVGRALPGEGDIDNRAFISALASMGYVGAVSIEMFPSEPWDHPAAFAAGALARVQALIASTDAQP